MGKIPYNEPWSCEYCEREFRAVEAGVNVDLGRGTGVCHQCAEEKGVDPEMA